MKEKKKNRRPISPPAPRGKVSRTPKPSLRKEKEKEKKIEKEVSGGRGGRGEQRSRKSAGSCAGVHTHRRAQRNMTQPAGIASEGTHTTPYRTDWPTAAPTVDSLIIIARTTRRLIPRI